MKASQFVEAWQKFEGPTWALAFVIYSSWLLLTYFYNDISPWVAVPLLVWFIAWQSSLQHEVLHGHPTKNVKLNTLLGSPALWLIYPYGLYKEYHLKHHNNEMLTDPIEDPESYYFLKGQWESLPKWRKALFKFNQTFLGRMLIGPLLSCWALVESEIAMLRAGDTSHLKHWAWHLPSLALVVFWVTAVCNIPFIEYALIVYPSLSLMLVRSYAEHRPAEDYRHRSVIVESNPLMRLLFLNNNYHVVHHDKPRLAWYDIPGYYRDNKDAFIKGNGNYVFKGYKDQIKAFFLKQKDDPVHPHL